MGRSKSGKLTKPAVRRHQQPLAPALEQRPDAAKTAAPSAAAQLQRAYGNQAVAQLARQAREQDAAQTEAVQLPANVGGQPLAAQVRQQMEAAFDTDFSAVRVHEGPQAAEIGALAYTQGTHIHFQPGQYDPASQAGQELLGHELAHVVQQQTGRVAAPQGQGVPINDSPALEAEADAAGARAARGEATLVAPIANPSGQPTALNVGPVQRVKWGKLLPPPLRRFVARRVRRRMEREWDAVINTAMNRVQQGTNILNNPPAPTGVNQPTLATAVNQPALGNVDENPYDLLPAMEEENPYDLLPAMEEENPYDLLPATPVASPGAKEAAPIKKPVLRARLPGETFEEWKARRARETPWDWQEERKKARKRVNDQQ